eukprot:TRINITY_DN18989_c0_g1::TRINITY_DN18989_c0_g1_i1::g.21664::m.21664 TRINITY_DN18989_c0_g1::TRINITY_DN18989_c0_g1_i1::g.21664  ORF type:complete len:606 (+),score=108.51,sp/Q6GL87/GRTP1_XENTR/32.65/8e-45,RabGAP-TBC/PF00566.13/1.2e-46,EF-hand_1/PF00036.27/0.0002,EF-hand_1/PF00036.27/0.013,EF-hand_1/PF00036.27/2e+02,EF-hand_6/PF13405.1/0.00022,EF-hand_6/PF13405.1/0.019,EF-hand_6/PF13405.1/2.4e+03,EF-hand_7/PF13499.1/2.1e-07,EF-hand_7/PF13499.1/5.8e+02,EF-hand_5/PF13202.1/0.01,EF-hand_5/PF13202.1/0.02
MVVADGEAVDLYGFVIPKQDGELYQEQHERYLKGLVRQTAEWNAYVLSQGFDAVNETSCEEACERLRDEKAFQLVRNGVPHSLRPMVWHFLSKHFVDTELEGSYAEYISQTCKEQHHRAIENDIHRTFPENAYFDTEEGRTGLRTLLRAYAVRNPKIGYCQSMNYIAGFLLLFYKDDLEKAFWILVRIIEFILPTCGGPVHGYYGDTMTGLQVDRQVFFGLIMKYLPGIGAQFLKMQLPVGLMCDEWLLCIYVNGVVPWETALRIWDCFFQEGNVVLFRIGLALLKLNQTAIMEAGDMCEIMDIVQRSQNKMYEADALIQTAYGEFGDLQAETIRMREVYYEVAFRHVERRGIHTACDSLVETTYFTAGEIDGLLQEFIKYPHRSEVGELPHIDIIGFQELVNVTLRDWKGSSCSMDRLFYVFDATQDGVVDFQEFVKALSTLCRGKLEDKLEMCFRAFDFNSDGEVDFVEMLSMTDGLVKMLPPDQILHDGKMFSASQFTDDIFKRCCGGNTDGKLDKKTFCEIAQECWVIRRFFYLDVAHMPKPKGETNKTKIIVKDEPARPPTPVHVPPASEESQVYSVSGETVRLSLDA